MKLTFAPLNPYKNQHEVECRLVINTTLKEIKELLSSSKADCDCYLQEIADALAEDWDEELI